MAVNDIVSRFYWLLFVAIWRHLRSIERTKTAQHQKELNSMEEGLVMLDYFDRAYLRFSHLTSEFCYLIGQGYRPIR